MRKAPIIPAIIGAACLLLCACNGPQPQSLPKQTIRVGGIDLSVEIAATDAQRGIGMMHRKSLSADEGMLFVFADDEMRSFYMKNTHVPLSIAYIKADGSIDRIMNMAPLTLESHESNSPCRYALEMPEGWFSDHGVGVGDIIQIPKGITAE
jgi:uncharacterized protein